MAEDLGEVRVRIEEEGAQDAADTIGDAVGEGMGGADQDGGAGGGIGGMLGGISTKLAGILGFVAFLSSLKPIQELLGGLQRLFSVAILPLVALLTTFLRPILQKLLRFIGNLDFNNLGASLAKNITPILDQLPSLISKAINNVGGNITDFTASDVAKDFGSQAVETGTKYNAASLPFTGAAALAESQGLNLSNPFNINSTGFDEQANTSLTNNSANSNAEVNQRETAGSQ